MASAKPDPRPLQFVVGKGGVGKSTVTAALALAHRRMGRRVLAVELGRREGLSRLMAPGRETAAEPIAVGDGLWLCRVQGDDALAEYLRLILPGRGLLDLVFASRLYRYFVAAAPGLKELMAIGKIWFERQKIDDSGKPLWDLILVDAGASGHSLQYLQMPATAARTFRSGLVHRESVKIASMMSDPATTLVHVVTTAEDMPLTEAREIIDRLRGELRLQVGSIFANRMRAPAPTGTTEAVARLEQVSASGTHGSVARAVAATARRSLSWTLLQEEKLARFVGETEIDPVRIPLLTTSHFDLAAIERIADGLLGSGDASGQREVAR